MSLRQVIVAMVIVAAAMPITVYADWTASGRFMYVDRPYDESGFTGVEPHLPIRFATVEVLDADAVGPSALLAVGATDDAGWFRITVADAFVRKVYLRVVSTSSAVADLELRVESIELPIEPYAVASADYPAHPPGADLDIGSIVAAIGAGGEAFNIYDIALRGIEFLASLAGERPDAGLGLRLAWDPTSLGKGSSYTYVDRSIRVGLPSAYNDTVIGHEMGHYAFHLHSATSTPGGTHYLSDCDQDLRLAYEEGRATWFGQSVLAYHHLPRPELYVRTTGAPGPGNLDFYFNVETATPFSCDGASSEVSVYTALWDLNDSAQTNDASPWSDDDFVKVAVADNWDVDSNYIPKADQISLEDFWDGWFDLDKGRAIDVIGAFRMTGVEFFPDASEPNDSAATPITADGSLLHLTYFSDPDGDGVGDIDEDRFIFDARAGFLYTIETMNLLGRANTSLILLDADGSTVLADNDDRDAGDPSSLIEYIVTVDGPLQLLSFHGPGMGIYGSYDLRLSAESFAGEPDPDAGGDPIGEVRITRVDWGGKNEKLTVEATSSAAPSATLTLVGYGEMSYRAKRDVYIFRRTHVARPDMVTVVSDYGGRDSALVPEP